MQNEYHTPPYLKKPEMPMPKFTKRIPILTHLENSNALMTKRIVRTPTLRKYKRRFTKRIVPVLTIEPPPRRRFTHELNLPKNTRFTKRIRRG
jgi:hypothetical protein